MTCAIKHYYSLFQSTLPRRERRCICLFPFVQVNHDFNPRSRGGSDFLAMMNFLLYNISIHAPAEGATATPLLFVQCPSYFNPRSRGGSDFSWCPVPAVSCNFNPRSRGGSDSKHTQFFRSNFRTKCAYLYFLLHYIFFTQNKQSYK